MKNTDISRILNSNEIQSVLLPKKVPHRHVHTRKNPLKNNSVLGRLCPYAPAEKRRAKLLHKKGSRLSVASAKKVKKHMAEKKKYGKKNKAFMKALLGAYDAKVEEAAEEEE
jgi:large subunit ribosomal protein L4e